MGKDKKEYCNVRDDDGHWYYIPVEDTDLFEEYEEICDICWGGGCEGSPTKKQYARCRELSEHFTPMMTGINGPI